MSPKPKRTGNAAPEQLAALQKQFAGHIRDPDHAPPPADVEDRRMEIYRSLFFNNLAKFLAGNFPVVRRLYEDEAWSALVRDFFVRHRARTPLFPEIPREFLAYLQDEREPAPEDPPFLLELAHWEWVELALENDEQEPGDLPVDPDGDLLTGCPVVSPLAWVVSYRWPVHRIGPDHRPDEPPPGRTHLLAYRDADDRVKFMELAALSALLLQRLQESPERSGRMTLKRLARDVGRDDDAAFVDHGGRLLAEFRQRGVILGTRPEE